MDLCLNNKYALVTGGSHGIGKAIAKSLRKEGCRVVICSRHKKNLEQAAKEICCDSIQADCTKDADIKRIARKFPEIDILVNNIGGGGRWGTEDYQDFNEWDDVYAKNAGAARKFTMSYLPYMTQKKWGRVITIASIFGKEAGGRPWFNMAKAAEISLMKSLSQKSLRTYKGITFNSICPGHIDIGNKQRFPIMGKPEDVANLVAFLCSDKARHINGACITVDGGESYSF